jgi:hypothetical protein
MSGYQTYYKIRVGDYRIGLLIDSREQLVEFNEFCIGDIFIENSHDPQIAQGAGHPRTGVDAALFS